MVGLVKVYPRVTAVTGPVAETLFVEVCGGQKSSLTDSPVTRHCWQPTLQPGASVEEATLALMVGEDWKTTPEPKFA